MTVACRGRDVKASCARDYPEMSLGPDECLWVATREHQRPGSESCALTTAGAGALSVPRMSRVTAIRASDCPHATYRCDSATSHYDPGGVHDVP